MPFVLANDFASDLVVSVLSSAYFVALAGWGLVGYTLGSIPFGLLLTRAAGLGDIRSVGSGNIGATNVLRTGHKGLAALTLVLDTAKGTLAVLLPHLLAAQWLPTGANGIEPALSELAASGAMLVAGACAFIGHIYPAWLGFRGGKGVATYIGVTLGLLWPAAIVFCAVWLSLAALTRYSSLSALIGSLAAPIAAWAMGHADIALVLALMSALLIWKHRANIERLSAGTEPKIGAKA
jgi:acyl phosphate:glycerol-3-phosphate acyltransferase